MAGGKLEDYIYTHTRSISFCHNGKNHILRGKLEDIAKIVWWKWKNHNIIMYLLIVEQINNILPILFSQTNLLQICDAMITSIPWEEL